MFAENIITLDQKSALLKGLDTTNNLFQWTVLFLSSTNIFEIASREWWMYVLVNW